MRVPSTRPPRFRVRINDDFDPELYCAGCHDWLPITVEFWPSKRSFWRCRACEAERSRLYQAAKRLDPESRIKFINKSRRFRAYLRNEEPELLTAVEAEHRERDAAMQRARRSDERRAYKREWMRRDREAKRKAEGREPYERRNKAA